MYGENHQFKSRKRPGANNRLTVTLTNADLERFNELETNITQLMPDEAMTRSKAFSTVLKYATLHLMSQDMGVESIE